MEDLKSDKGSLTHQLDQVNEELKALQSEVQKARELVNELEEKQKQDRETEEQNKGKLEASLADLSQKYQTLQETKEKEEEHGRLELNRLKAENEEKELDIIEMGEKLQDAFAEQEKVEKEVAVLREELKDEREKRKSVQERQMDAAALKSTIEEQVAEIERLQVKMILVSFVFFSYIIGR